MLTLFEKRALSLLQERRGQTVTRAELLAAIYSDCDLPKSPNSNTLEVFIGRVRRKSEPGIKAVRGIGYTLPESGVHQ